MTKYMALWFRSRGVNDDMAIEIVGVGKTLEEAVADSSEINFFDWDYVPDTMRIALVNGNPEFVFDVQCKPTIHVEPCSKALYDFYGEDGCAKTETPRITRSGGCLYLEDEAMA